MLSILNVNPTNSAEDFALSSFIANAVNRVVFVDGDVVIRQGDLGEAMYFIADGQVEVLHVRGGDELEMEQLAVLGRHSFFGEMGLLHPEGRSMATCRTIDFCSGWELRLPAYEMAIKRFPHFKDVLEAAAKLRLRAGQLKAQNGKAVGGGKHDEEHFSVLGDRARKAHENKVRRPSCQWHFAHLPFGTRLRVGIRHTPATCLLRACHAHPQRTHSAPTMHPTTPPNHQESDEEQSLAELLAKACPRSLFRMRRNTASTTV